MEFNSNIFGTVRMVLANDEPWFVGKDVAECLGYSRTNKMRCMIDDSDCMEIDPQNSMYTGLHQNGATLEPNKNIRRMLLINESGLYQAIFGSTLPTAKNFKHWVTSEILPSIRKHGAYMTNETLEQALMNPDTLIQLALNLKAEQEKVKELTPKAKVYDAYMSQEGTVSTTTMAKRYGLTARQLNKMLHDLGIQFKIGSTWYLYDKYSGKGYVKMVSAPIEGSSTLKSYTSMRWTPKGQEFVHNIVQQQLILN